ncbi:heavy-metal-associated domain-containing protein [Dietzia maris]|uniref:heavy-metal-associated domain-containing protein n=1 Tax=Dietzia maris TaxID=37915 RepID=UPI00223B36A2|nr:heavy-metal-associated domain-containing protein [Dietzia maris]MCT1432241.1 cation transporter [Dietzia maris]MCT1519503.1 cation transporter [Dietzia maris]
MATSTKEYTVQGMTCGHCESSVKEEVGEVAGVSVVEASSKTGTVSVSGEGFTDEQVVAAVKEAGYTVTS